MECYKFVAIVKIADVRILSKFSNLSKAPVSNSFIYTNIFQACAALANFNLGAQADADAIKGGLISYLYGESALVTMYSKCGMLDYATQAFESTNAPDTVAWTAIMSGSAYHGNASEALRLFRRMQDSGVRPNAITFVAVLTACSHSSLITEAEHYIDSMHSEYGVDATIDHYSCMIDIYARAGLLKEGFELIKSMPFDPDKTSWKCLLSGCWTHKNLELGKIAADNVLKLDPEDSSGYVLLFNLYASSGKWEEASHIRKMMTEKFEEGAQLQLDHNQGQCAPVVVCDKHHPQTQEIYRKQKEFNYFTTNHENGLLVSNICRSEKNNFLTVVRDLLWNQCPYCDFQEPSGVQGLMILQNMCPWSPDVKLLLEMPRGFITSSQENILATITGDICKSN